MEDLGDTDVAGLWLRDTVARYLYSGPTLPRSATVTWQLTSDTLQRSGLLSFPLCNLSFECVLLPTHRTWQRWGDDICMIL